MTADLKDDPLAKILWDVERQTLQCVLLAMAVSFFLFNYQPWKCQRSFDILYALGTLNNDFIMVGIRHYYYLAISMDSFLSS